MAKAARDSGTSLASLSLKSLQKELNKRVRRVETMRRKRDRMQARVDRLSSQIAEVERVMGISSRAVRRGPGRGRVRNDSSLAEMLAKVLKGKTMGVMDVAEAVQSAGYKTNAENFRTIVNQTLIKHKTLFKKVGRGRYTAA